MQGEGGEVAQGGAHDEGGDDGRPDHLSSGWQVRLADMLSAQQFRCLVLCVLGGSLRLCHDVTSFTYEVRIDRYVIAFAGGESHCATPSKVVIFCARRGRLGLPETRDCAATYSSCLLLIRAWLRAVSCQARLSRTAIP